MCASIPSAVVPKTTKPFKFDKARQVEAMKRRDLYQRMNLLERINEGTKKAQSLLEQRAALQEQRRSANMEASFQRQRLQVNYHLTMNWTTASICRPHCFSTSRDTCGKPLQKRWQCTSPFVLLDRLSAQSH